MNAIHVIKAYKYLGMWVFDDPKVGLVQEPFVSGADGMIDRIVGEIRNAEQGFSMIFSAASFPGHQARLEWRGRLLCPALLRYFDAPPQEINVQVKSLSRP